MARDFENLQTRLEELKQFQAELKSALTMAQEALAASGSLPPVALVEQLKDYKQQFCDLKVEILGNSAAENDSVSIADMEKGIDSKQVTDKARGVLARVVAIQHIGQSDFVPLQECRVVCDEILKELDDSSTNKISARVIQLAENNHPFCNLLTLIESSDDLDDETWSKLHDSIATSVGNLLLTPTSGQLLATAIARSKLAIDASSVQTPSLASEKTAKTESRPDVASPTATEPDAQKPQTVKSDRSSAAPEIQPSVTGSKPQAATLPPNGSANVDLKDHSAILEPVPKRAPQRNWSEAKSVKIGHNSPIIDLAFVAQTSRDENQAQLLQQLTWKLLMEEQYGLAYHVATCLEKHPHSLKQFVPSWFVRSIALGKAIRFPVGDVAQQLTQDYENVDAETIFTNDDEWNISVRLLLLASGLRSSILAPATSAAKLLHLFERREEFNELNNYALRIALYGDQGNPLDPNAFKRMQTESEWQDLQDEFTTEVNEWLAQGSRKAISYNSVSHCFLHSHWSMRPSRAIQYPATVLNWKMWQEVLNAVHGLLKPISSSEFRDMAFVKKEISRIGNPKFLDEIQKQYEPPKNSSVVQNSPSSVDAIQAYLEKSLELARRWVSLNSSRPNEAGVSVPERQETLRDDIFKRQDSCLKELKAFALSHAESLPITAAVACCCRVIEDIRLLFDADTAFPTEKIDMRHILHADLLKSPQLSMNDKWEPQLDPETFETELLHLLSQQSITWKEAFEERSRHRDHEATERILSLDVWDGSGEIEELRAIRTRRVQQCRDAVSHSLQETQEMIDEAVKLGLLTELDFAGLNSQVENIRTTIPTTLHFSHCIKRLIQIRSGIERRRQSEIDRVRQRFQQLRIQSDAKEFHRINEALDGGDLTRANEFIDRVSTDLSDSSSDWVMDFFSDDTSS